MIMTIMEFEQSMRDLMAATNLHLIMFWILGVIFVFAVIALFVSIVWVSKEIARELEDEKAQSTPATQPGIKPFHYHDVA
jgi:hypothetical protein